MSNYIDNIVKNAVTYDLVSKPLADDMANEFSIKSTYAVGDYVMHDYTLYKCISAVTTAGNWDSAKWQECKIGDEINGGVKFTAQTLTSEQKAQARNNIGGASQADLEALNAVRYDQAQTLTTAQKTQARANIGAVSQEEATPDAIRYSAQSLTDAQKNQARVNVGTVASTSIAEEFSTSKAYAVGDMVMYDSKLYKFKTAHSVGAWNNAQVDAVSVKEEISSLSNDLSETVRFTEQTLTISQKSQAKKNLEIYDGFNDDIKRTLLACFQNVAWIDNDGLSYYNALVDALYALSIDCTWIYDSASGNLLDNFENAEIDSNLSLGTVSKAIGDGGMRIYAEASSTGNRVSYLLTPNTSTSAIIETQVMFLGVPKSAAGNGFQLWIGDGTYTAHIATHKRNNSSMKLGTYEYYDNAMHWVDLCDIQLNVSYILHVELSNNTAILKVNGTEILRTTRLNKSSYYYQNILSVGTPNDSTAGAAWVAIKWIKFKDLTEA